MQISAIHNACFLSDQFSPLKILTVLMIFHSMNVYSQAMPGPDIKGTRRFISSFEILAGPNHSWFWGDESISKRVANINYAVGIGLIHDTDRRFYFNVRLLYENKGHKTDFDYSLFDDPDNSNISHSYRTIFTQRLEYATVSVIPGVYVDSKKTLSVGLGGYVGYLIKATTQTKTFKEGLLIQNTYQDDTGQYFLYDVGSIFYAKVQSVVGKKVQANIQPTITTGLLNIRNPDLPATPLKNFTVTILIGINLLN